MDNIKLYKTISLEIISAIKNKEVNLIGELLDKRQSILDSEVEKEYLINGLKDKGIIEIDTNIHKLLLESIEDIKLEIKKHKQVVKVNNSYINSSKENVNIFHKKV